MPIELQNFLTLKHDIVNLKLEMNTLLRANSKTSTTLQRQPRGAAAAAAAVLGIGIGIGDKLLSFIKSVFGGSQKTSDKQWLIFNT